MYIYACDVFELSVSNVISPTDKTFLSGLLTVNIPSHH